MTTWLFSLPMTEDRNLLRSENCRWWDNSLEPGALAGGAGKRTGRAVWPYTEDTDWCGSFKLRSYAESEPDKEEF